MEPVTRPGVAPGLFLASVAVVFALEVLAAKMPAPAGAVAALWMKIALPRVLETAAVLLLACLFPPGLSALGIKRGRILSGIGRGILWGLCFLGFVAIAGAALVIFMHFPLARFFAGSVPSTKGFAFLVSYLFLGTVMAGVSEEILFRGLVYGFLRRWGVAVALVLSTAMFAYFHGAAPYTQIVGGVLFGASYEKEKNLLVPMTLHAGGNFLLFALGIYFS